jgi:hypothetical protein
MKTRRDTIYITALAKRTKGGSRLIWSIQSHHKNLLPPRIPRMSMGLTRDIPQEEKHVH